MSNPNDGLTKAEEAEKCLSQIFARAREDGKAASQRPSILSEIFKTQEFRAGAKVEYPLDLDYVAYTIPNCTRVPDCYIMDEVIPPEDREPSPLLLDDQREPE